MLQAIPRGTTRVFTATVTLDGEAVDVSGDTSTLFVKENIDDTDAEALMTVAGDMSAGATGVITVTITPSDSDIEPGIYIGELRLDRVDSSVYVLKMDDVQIVERVSDVA